MTGDWQELAANSAGAGALGILGRLLAMAHSDRRPLGWSLLWEVPTAIGMGLIGKGIAVHLGLSVWPEYALTIAVAYVGPRVIDLALAVARKRLGVER